MTLFLSAALLAWCAENPVLVALAVTAVLNLVSAALHRWAPKAAATFDAIIPLAGPALSKALAKKAPPSEPKQ